MGKSDLAFADSVRPPDVLEPWHRHQDEPKATASEQAAPERFGQNAAHELGQNPEPESGKPRASHRGTPVTKRVKSRVSFELK